MEPSNSNNNPEPDPKPAASEHQASNAEPKNEPNAPVTPPVIKEIHHHHYHGRGLGFGRLIIGTVLILVGLAYLANLSGWTHINFNWWHLWPLLIVCLGLSMLSRHGAVSWIIGSVVTIIVIGAVAALLFTNGFNWNNKSVSTQQINIEKISGAETASISVVSAAGNLNISAGADKLVSGQLESNWATLKTESELLDTTQNVTITTNGNWSGFGGQHNTLTVKPLPNIPTSLNIDSGASNDDLDLRQIEVDHLTIDAGASRVHVVFGDLSDQCDATIKAGASSIEVSVPQSVGIHLRVDSGVTSQNLAAGFNKIDDHTFETEGFSQATKKINLTLSLGVASLKVTRE